MTITDFENQNFRPLSMVRNPNTRYKTVGSLLLTRGQKLFIAPVYEKGPVGARQVFYGEPVERQGFTVISRKGLKRLINTQTGEEVSVKAEEK
jgi:hypothetical protein